jgi:hypothetical protein
MKGITGPAKRPATRGTRATAARRDRFMKRLAVSVAELLRRRLGLPESTEAAERDNKMPSCEEDVLTYLREIAESDNN